MIITPATVAAFDPTTWTARVQPDGLLATFLRAVPVSRTISPALLKTGARVSMIVYDDNNPSDGMVIGVTAEGAATRVGAVPNLAACRVYSNAAVSVTNNTQRSVPFTNARFDTLSDAGLTPMWSSSVASDTIYCRQPGIWEATAQVEFATNATGWRVAAIQEIASGVLVAAQEVPAVTGETTNLSLSSGPVKLTGITGGFQLLVNQNSGGALNVDSAAQYTPEMGVVQLG